MPVINSKHRALDFITVSPGNRLADKSCLLCHPPGNAKGLIVAWY
jgi:hypothetical protein